MLNAAKNSNRNYTKSVVVPTCSLGDLIEGAYQFGSVSARQILSQVQAFDTHGRRVLMFDSVNE